MNVLFLLKLPFELRYDFCRGSVSRGFIVENSEDVDDVLQVDLYAQVSALMLNDGEAVQPLVSALTRVPPPLDGLQSLTTSLPTATVLELLSVVKRLAEGEPHPAPTAC